MFVLVALDSYPPRVSLEEPDDTRRFHLAVRGGTDRALVFGALVGHAVPRWSSGWTRSERVPEKSMYSRLSARTTATLSGPA